MIEFKTITDHYTIETLANMLEGLEVWQYSEVDRVRLPELTDEEIQDDTQH